LERGDVLVLGAPRDARGHEQRGRRYAVVLQSDALLPYSTVIVAPTSTAARAADFRPEIRVQRARTRVVVDQLAALDVDRLGDRVGRVSGRELAELDDALALVLDLS
jgi:mRNA interferase MazF